MGTIFTANIILFIVITFTNVILMTTKSILTIKSTRIVASIMNAFAYGFYAILVKSMVNIDMDIVVIVTIIANLIGVYVSMWLLEKFRKDKLWEIKIIASRSDSTNIAETLQMHDIFYTTLPIYTKYGVRTKMDIFSNTQKESVLIKEVLGNFDITYTVTEHSKTL